MCDRGELDAAISVVRLFLALALKFPLAGGIWHFDRKKYVLATCLPPVLALCVAVNLS